MVNVDSIVAPSTQRPADELRALRKTKENHNIWKIQRQWEHKSMITDGILSAAEVGSVELSLRGLAEVSSQAQEGQGLQRLIKKSCGPSAQFAKQTTCCRVEGHHLQAKRA